MKSYIGMNEYYEDLARQNAARREAEARRDASSEIADALVGAEEILEVLSHRGTRGIERECGAGRIADVLATVRAAKRHLA